MRELQIPIFLKGQLVYELPSVADIRKYCLEQINTLWEEVTRFENPHRYYVDLSSKLWTLRQELLAKSK